MVQLESIYTDFNREQSTLINPGIPEDSFTFEIEEDLQELKLHTTSVIFVLNSK